MTKGFVTIIFIISLIIGSVAGFQFQQYLPFIQKSAEVQSEVAGVNVSGPEQSVQIAQTIVRSPVPTSSSVAENQLEGIVPVKLIIPKLKINAAVEHVGLDSKKNMDVPKNASNVAWYELGYKPGQSGNAVIAGHLDRSNGAPAVFYGLSKLVIGDRFSVVAEDGNMLEFQVTGRRTYSADTFPISTVFGSIDKPRLNLITCSGTWNKAARSYSTRTVVFSELVEN